jgi:peflin
VSCSGSLSEQELSSALVNADYTSFDPYTIKALLHMFSSTPTKSHITFEEFINLWRFLAAWRELFERFDEDRSGHISLLEFGKALVAFGYRLSQPFTAVLYNSFNDRGAPGRSREGMSFDLFVQACVSLKRMTDVFKGYDDDRDGYVTLSFEEFLTEILRLRE